MFGSAFGVGLGGCLGIIAAFIVVFFLIALCTAALGGGGGGGGRNKGASRAYDSAELAYAPNLEEEDVFHDVRISTRLLEGFPLPPLHIHTPPISTSLSLKAPEVFPSLHLTVGLERSPSPYPPSLLQHYIYTATSCHCVKSAISVRREPT
jgi:hypothetical protein